MSLSDRSDDSFDWVIGQRPPKLKTLVIDEFIDVPSSFTHGLDELQFPNTIESIYDKPWIEGQYFKHVHKKIRKVVFDFNKNDYDEYKYDDEKHGNFDSQEHDKNIAYLKQQFPDSEITFRDIYNTTNDDRVYRVYDL